MSLHYRRAFLRQGISLALAAAGSHVLCGESPAEQATLTPDKSQSLPLLDTHQHLWDLSKFRLPWLAANNPLHRSFLPKDYEDAARGLNIVKTVYMEVDVDPSQHVAEAEYVVDLCRRGEGPMRAAVVGGRPGADDFPQYIRRFKDSPYVKGVRHIPQTTALWKEKAFLRGIRLLGEMGMSFDLCMPPAGLPAAIELVDQCRGTRFILDHCGNADPKWFQPAPAGAAKADDSRREADQWQKDIRRIAERQHVVCKISGIVARAPKGWKPEDLAPVINRCLDAFGPDRVMFGGDWPVCTQAATLRQWGEALKAIIATRPVEQQRKLLHDNAARFYGLA